MRRADRLFQLVQLLRRRRAVTAAELARSLEVSERTVYRDVRDLSLSGVPIEGEAGVGYRLKPGFDLPPLMFTADELQALRLGAQIVRSWADEGLSNAAASALQRIESVLPDRLRKEANRQFLFAPGFMVTPEMKAWMADLRSAMRHRHKVEITYCKAGDAPSARVVEPLGLYFWGRTWTLGAWCELRAGFRTFRLDRIASLAILTATTFTRTPEDYIRHAEES
ncbi:MAG: YafY family transcriptional regulator [Bryobacterales bacterium]|nr:YafY family transcriptional regulator [Bryobacterales bacterium]